MTPSTLHTSSATRTAVLLVAFLVASLMSPGPVAGQSTAVLHIVSLEARPPSWSDEAAHGTTVNVTLRNDGDAGTLPFVLEYHWVAKGRTKWLNGNQQASTDASESSIPPGQTTVLHFSWALQFGEVGDGAVTLNLTHGRQHESTSLGLTIPVHSVTAALERASDPGQPIRPGETLFWRAWANNSGNVPEPLVWSVQRNGAEPFLHTMVSAPPGPLLPGEHRVATLLAIAPTSQDTSRARGPFDAPLTLQANLTYRAPRILATPSVRSASDGFPPGHAFALERLGEGDLFVPPGGSALLGLRLRNAASTDLDDTYHVRLQAPSGWTADVQPACPTDPGPAWPGDPPCLALRALESSDVRALVTSPAGAATTEAATLVVTVSSDHGQQQPLAVQVAMRRSGPGLSLGALTTSAEAYVADHLTGSIALRNVGDQASPACQIHLQAAPAGPSPPTLSQVLALAALAPQGTRDVAFDMGAIPAGGRWTLRASLEPAPGSDASLCDAASAPATAPVTVHAPAFLVTPPSTGLSGIPGEAVGYRLPPHAFVLANQGNAPETVDLQATTDLGDVALDDSSTLTLAAGEARTIPLTHGLPLSTQGRLVGHLRVEVRLRGQVWGANATTSVHDLLPPRLQLLAGPGSVWATGTPIELLVQAVDETGVNNVTAIVSSAGAIAGVPAIQNLTLASTDRGWHLAPPLPLPSGNYTFALRSADLAGNVARMPAWPVQVRPVPPPRLTLSGLSTNQSASGPLRIDVTDDLAVESVHLQDVAGGNGTQATVVNGSALLDLAPLRLAPGNHTLLATASNVAGAEARLLFVVQVPAPPPEPLTPSEPAPHAGKTTSRQAPGPGALLWAVAVVLMAARGRRDWERT